MEAMCVCYTPCYTHCRCMRVMQCWGNDCARRHSDIQKTFICKTVWCCVYLRAIQTQLSSIALQRCPCCVTVGLLFVCVRAGQKSRGFLVGAAVEHRQDKIPGWCSQPQIQNLTHTSRVGETGKLLMHSNEHKSKFPYWEVNVIDGNCLSMFLVVFLCVCQHTSGSLLNNESIFTALPWCRCLFQRSERRPSSHRDHMEENTKK